MKKNEVPQDNSFLKGYTRDLCYVKNESGEYETTLSTGWDVKHEALVATWKEIEEKAIQAIKLVENGEKSPIYYYMELKVMDLSLLKSYTGFRKWVIKRHLQPRRFYKLNEQQMKKYADAFNITIDELKNPQHNT